MTGIANGLARLLIPAMDKGFRVNGRCDGCGICAKVCPVHNIEMSSGRPVWQHRCVQCMACLHWCPASGLDFGKKTETWLHKCPGMKLDEYLAQEGLS